MTHMDVAGRALPAGNHPVPIYYTSLPPNGRFPIKGRAVQAHP
jgi:hypothetical protein